MIVINKSTQNIIFKIGAEKVLIVGGNVLNTIKDETWDALYAKYKEKNEPFWFVFCAFGGDNKTRTYDLYDVNVAL